MSFIVLFAGIGLVASFFTLTAFEKGDAAYFSCLIPLLQTVRRGPSSCLSNDFQLKKQFYSSCVSDYPCCAVVRVSACWYPHCLFFHEEYDDSGVPPLVRFAADSPALDDRLHDSTVLTSSSSDYFAAAENERHDIMA
jgi:hypothetical protein